MSNLCENSYLCNFVLKLYKTDHIPQIRNQSQNDDILQKHENLRFAPALFIILNFAFLIDIIDNIITYSPYYVTRTSANGSAVY